jgi:hypothetical protein
LTDEQCKQAIQRLEAIGWYIVGPHTKECVIFSSGLYPGVTKRDLVDSFKEEISDLDIPDDEPDADDLEDDYDD